MIGGRELNFDEYLGILRRRLWVILIPALIGPVVGYTISLEVPNRYTSRARILVDRPKVPVDYVRPVVESNIFERLATMREQILTRTRLQPIIERYGLYAEGSNKPSTEAQVASMSKDIGVLPTTFESGGMVTAVGFSVMFTADSPKTAQQVCADLTSMFLEENLKMREETAQGTSEFMNKQVQDTKRYLDDLDAKLAEFKSKYLGGLPGEEQGNLNMMLSLNSQLDSTSQALNRMAQDKAYLESVLSQQLASSQAAQKGGPEPITLEQQMAQMEDQLALLEARYTPQHPDIIKLKTDIAQLQKKIDETDSSDSGQQAVPKPRKKAQEPQSIQQLRRQLMVMDQDIHARKHEKDVLESKIVRYEGYLHLSPGVEEQYKKLTRDYQTAMATYEDLLKKKTQSTIATDLERRQEGEQFRLVEAATLPLKPSYPDRQKFGLSGLGVGLMLGGGIALLLEVRDKVLRTDKDVEFYLELPALAVLPDISKQHSEGSKERLWNRAKSMIADKRQALGV